MPQYRQNFITKEWVIVAPERAKRPDQFAAASPIRPHYPKRDERCPFCPGNEAQTPEAVLTRGSADSWSLRVVPNKFAAVSGNLTPARKPEGRFLSADGFGIAEVIIESPLHNTCLGLMPTMEVRHVLEAYKSRYSALAQNDDVDLITIFRNHGPGAGTSLVHPHSQIIATPIVPPLIRLLMQQAVIYHDTYGGCPYCDMLAEELSSGERIVAEGKHFVVLCPYASRTPFETRIMPKGHHSRFDDIGEEELDELADTLHATLKKIHVGLANPDYNFVIRTAPTSERELHYGHWHLIIMPKVTTPAGFEIGSGIYINTMPPESAASFLKGIGA